jgi:hypothetical protein
VEVAPLYTRALAILANGVGEEHPDYARILANAASWDLEQGRTADAISRYRRSVEILTATLGSNNPEVIAERHQLESIDNGRTKNTFLAKAR